MRDTARQRFSNFDSDFFALGPNASPAQARRALEAHLAETDRRMEEAGRLGTALVAQRKELEERLQEVANQQEDSQLSEELKQRLADIEKEYNEVARESARAFLPKPRVPSNEATGGSHTAPDGKGGRVRLRTSHEGLPPLLTTHVPAFREPLQVRGPCRARSHQARWLKPEIPEPGRPQAT